MPGAVLESRAIVTAEDRASATLAAIQKRVDALTKSTTALGKAFGLVESASKNMDGFSKAGAAQRKIDDLTKSSANLNKALREVGTTANHVAAMTSKVAAAAAAVKAATPRVSTSSPSPALQAALINRVNAQAALAQARAQQVNQRAAHSRGYAGGVSVGIGNGMRAGFGFGGSGLLGTIKELAVSSAVIHVGHGVIDGLKDMNNQRQSAIQQGMSPEEIARATNVANRLAHKFKSTSVAGNFETYLETAAISHDENIRAEVTDLFARRAQLGLNVGQSTEQVRGGQLQFMKALDTLGLFAPDHKSGEVDVDRMRKYFEAAMKVQGVEKGNLSDAMILQTAKYLKASGVAITEEGWKRALFYAAEAGSSGANEANRMMTTFSGTAKKETIPKLISDGFMEADGQKKGKKGKPGRYIGLRPADEDAANADPRAWAADHVIAAMKKNGLDFNDKNEVVKYIRSLGTNQQTANYLIKATTQRLEAQRQLEQAERVKVSEGDATKGQASSINAAWQAIESRIKDLGSAGDDNGGNLIAKGLNHVAERIDALNQFARDPSIKNGLAVGQTAGEIAAIVIAKAGFDKLLDKGGLAASGVALNGSATALAGSAEALTAAAARLGGVPGARSGVVALGGAAAGAAPVVGSALAAVPPVALGLAAGAVAAFLGHEIMSGLTAIGAVSPNIRPGKASGHWETVHNGRSSYRKWISDSLFERFDNEHPKNPSILGRAYTSLTEEDPWAHKKGYWLGAPTFHGEAAAGVVRGLTDPSQTIARYGGFGAGAPPIAGARGGLASIESLAGGLKATVERPIPVNVTGSAELTNKISIEVSASPQLVATVKSAEAAKIQVPLRSNSGASTPDAGGRKP